MHFGNGQDISLCEEVYPSIIFKCLALYWEIDQTYYSVLMEDFIQLLKDVGKYYKARMSFALPLRAIFNT